MNDGAGSALGDSGTPSGAARRAADALVGLAIAERYRIERTVSVGAHTVITDATDTEVGRTVTLKLIRPEFSEDPDFRRRFDQAMRAMSGLSHPHIAAIYDWGETVVSRRTTMFAVVEHLAGGSLRDLFDRGRWLTPSQALVVGLEACRALDYAHRRQIAHSEITPSKLVFGDDRRLRIVDFGLARLLGLAAWRDPATVATHTARYASPEQALGQPINGKSDVYALGLCLVEAVTGSVPFAADSTVGTLTGRIGKLMPVSADLGSLASVLERAGRPEPADRWTAAEFGRALVQAASSLSRPEPLPLLISPVFDEQQLRRPNDPTGGIERPPDPVVVVPVSDDESEPADDTDDLGTGVDPAEEPPTDDQAPTGEEAPIEEEEPPADEEPPAGGEAPTDDEPPTADEMPTDEELPSADVPHDDAPTAIAAAVGSAVAGDENEHTAAVHVGDEPDDDDDDQRRAGAAGAAGGVTGAERPLLYDGAEDVPDDERLDLAATAQHGPDIVPPIPPPAPGDVGDRPGSGDDGSQGDTRRRWPWFVLAIVLLGALAGLGYVTYSMFATPRHDVPDLAGRTEAQAREAVADFDWDLATRTERSDDEPDVGQIIRTSPEAGDDLAEGEPFLLVISKGPELREIPDFVEMTDAEARTALAKLDLESSKADPVFHEVIPESAVVRWTVPGEPDIKAGDSVLPGTKIELTLSKGPEPREVPDLVDVPVTEARQTVEDLRLRFERTEDDAFHNTIPKNNIIRQWPDAGEKLDRGGRVVVLVSKGPDYREIPDMSGMNVNRAVARLERAGFKRGQVMGVGNEGTFRNACVDGEIVDVGDEYVRGTTVDLVFLTQDPRDQEGTVHCSGF